jgi:hypothetical protein
VDRSQARRNGEGDRVRSVLVGHVGTLDLLDLQVIGSLYGRDFLPYPFMFTRPSRFAMADEASAYARAVPDRFHHGDLKVFAECVFGYADADIRVECHVQYIPADTASVRVIAYRTGQLGFLAAQQPDTDRIDFYTVSPYDLGAAICEELWLTQPGRHSRIVVPKYAPKTRADFDTGDFAVHHTLEMPTAVTIPAGEVSAYSRVQSHRIPRRDWGFDGRKKAVLWIRVIDDGEYIYVPDLSHAVPMTKPALNQRIDELISEDVAVLRELRGD